MSIKVYQQVIDEHLSRLERLAEKRGVSKLRRVYQESQAEVEAKLKKLVRGGKKDSFTAHTKRLVLAQLVHGQKAVMGNMGEELGAATTDAQRDVLSALSRDINKLEKAYSGSTPVLPVEDVALFQGVIEDRAPSLLRRHEESLDKYGQRNVAKVEQELSKSLLQGESQHEAIDRVVETLDNQWWEGERIVRTELAYASNSTQHDGIKSAREVLPDMMMQWRELVSDSGVPLDDRVGIDSLALHGQVAAPGSMFICPRAAPDGEQVPDALAWESIAFPPNRPNDRATLAPWRRDWGIPAWRFVGGRRVPML